MTDHIQGTFIIIEQRLSLGFFCLIPFLQFLKGFAIHTLWHIHIFIIPCWFLL